MFIRVLNLTITFIRVFVMHYLLRAGLLRVVPADDALLEFVLLL